MVLTPSRMVRLGAKAPDFTLNDVVTGQPVHLSSFADKKALLVMFICRHCPYVQHIKHELSRLDKDYRGKDIAMVAISSNDIQNYPDDAPENLRALAIEQDWHFPFLFDSTQGVAKKYMAACTPDFFLYSQSNSGDPGDVPVLVYRGQLDDSRPGNGKPVTGKDLREAMDAVLTGKPVPKLQHPGIGCNIKWKKGNEPDYFK